MVHDELKKEGKSVHIVVVNSDPALAYQKSFIDVAAFPLYQYTTATNAWGLHAGGKDDLIIYDKAGKVLQFLPFSGPISTAMNTAEGWANVKNAILAALAK